MQDLLLNDPADKLPLRSVHHFFHHIIAKCTVDDKLDCMFEKFRHGESHMAFVYANDSDKNGENREAVGIVTLEDVIEELVQNEILDEADCKRENKKKSWNYYLKY
jgi:metal transporter CNNM